MNKQAQALKVLNLKKGDKVKIYRKVASYTEDWDNWWAPEMDLLVGQEVIVERVIPDYKGVTFQTEAGFKASCYIYPATALVRTFEL